MKILVLNAGSSSQKSCLFDFSSSPKPSLLPHPLWEATIDWNDNGLLKVKANGIRFNCHLSLDDRTSGIKTMLETMITGDTKVIDNFQNIDVVGHRVVHGGTKYSQAIVIDQQVKNTIKELIPLAPNHNPAHLEGIEAIENILGEVTQIAVFDTAFHSTIPDVAKIYPIPYQFYEKGIQRYGFHGISHEYVAHRTAEILTQPLENLNLITCHLGNGCSITAVKGGKSVNTSMGFTPLEGVMMGSRSGSIDPAILIHLMDEYNFDSKSLNQLLNKESGLLGISGISSDLRPILEANASGNPHAQLAVNMYVFRIQQVISSLLPSLGVLSALVFTAGVGENSSFIREKVCEGFGFLGLKLDTTKNNQSLKEENIALSDSTVKILVVPTQEDSAIALQCQQIMNR